MSKMLTKHNIILLFSDFYNLLSFNVLLLMRKCYNCEVTLIFLQIVLRNNLDPDPNSMNMDPKHCTSDKSVGIFAVRFKILPRF